MNIFQKHELTQLLGSDDFFLWEYYGKGVLGKIQAWIFRSRIEMLLEFLKEARLKCRIVLDIGCGPMFVSCPLLSSITHEYIGVDIMRGDKLKNYRNVMRKIGTKRVEVVRASAESLPFRNEMFDFVLSLDVLEHLDKPRRAIMEIFRVVENDRLIVVSIPLENSVQRLSRIGFVLMKIGGNPILKSVRQIPVARTPEYHYKGEIKSYDSMVRALKDVFQLSQTRYSPLGFHKSINLNALHILRKKDML